jgi:hypothetical protein
MSEPPIKFSREWRFQKPSQPAAFTHALQREHNAPVTPFLPRSIARVRKASYEAVKNVSISRKPLTFRSKSKRK